MVGLHETEVGVNKYIFVCGCSTSKKGGGLSGLVWGFISSRERRIIVKLDYVCFNINH